MPRYTTEQIGNARYYLREAADDLLRALDMQRWAPESERERRVESRCDDAREAIADAVRALGYRLAPIAAEPWQAGIVEEPASEARAA